MEIHYPLFIASGKTQAKNTNFKSQTIGRKYNPNGHSVTTQRASQIYAQANLKVVQQQHRTMAMSKDDQSLLPMIETNQPQQQQPRNLIGSPNPAKDGMLRVSQVS